MESSVFSRAALAAPWGVESGDLGSGVFHAVVRGRAWACLADDQSRVELERGDVVVFPFGDNHLITDAPDTPTRLIGDLTTVDDRGMGHLVVSGDGHETSLICGRLTFDEGDAHPVFSMLPRLIHVRDTDGRVSNVVESLIGLIAAEVDRPVPGSETVIARLTDVLVVFVLRDSINRLEPGEGGWLGALREPGICDALGLIHRHPGRPLNTTSLATAAGMSRSTFFLRFRQAVGETPAEYLTRWRIHVATRMLREEDCSVAAAARRVGYGTEAAFSNAFVRIMGIRPGAYRRAA